MSSPQVRTVEYDLSKRVPSFNGMVGLVIGNFEKGSTSERMYVTRQDEVDKRLGKPGPASSDAYYVLHSFLTKSQRCWVRRVSNQAKYAGAVVGSAFHTLLGTGDGILTTFTGILPFSRCLPNSVTVYVDKDKVGYDVPTINTFGGSISGANPRYNVSEEDSDVNYSSGAITVEFTEAIPSGAKVYARWGFPTIDFVANDASSELLLAPTSYDWNSREIQITLRSTGRFYADNLNAPLLASSAGATQSTAKLKIFDNGTLVAWGDSAGDLFNATGVTFLDSGATKTVNYTTGAVTFKVQSNYFYAGPITVTYYEEITDSLAHEVKVYNDTFSPIPVVAPPTGATQSTTTVKIYDGVTLVAWGNDAGVVTNASGVTFLDGTATKTVNYTSGVIQFTVHADYTILGTISAKYYTLADTFSPEYTTKQYSDILPPFPVSAPEGTVSSEATATVRIYDGTTLVAYADEDGVLTDHNSSAFLDTGTFTVNYSTGVIAFTIKSAYTVGGVISAKYSSELADYCVVYSDSEGEHGNSTAVLINNIDIVNETFDVVLYERVSLGGGVFTDNLAGESYTLSRVEKLDGYNKQLFM